MGSTSYIVSGPKTGSIFYLNSGSRYNTDFVLDPDPDLDQIYKDRFGFRTSMVLPWIGPVCIPSFSDNIFFFRSRTRIP